MQMKKPKKIIKLSLNENVYGCSPLVKAAIKKHSEEVHLYPDFFQQALKEKLAVKCKVTPQNILLGVGAVGIIDNIIQFLVKTKEEIITFERSFVAYGQLAAIHGRKCHFASLTDFTCDINNIFPLVNKKTRVIFIANPNNPTGTIIFHNDLKNLLQKISPDIFVVIDEAYCEYVTDKNYPDSLKLFSEFPNLIILKSFSKIYGLAGIRIGHGIANEKVATELEKRKLPFSINSIASIAAMAALSDKEFVIACAKKNKEEREFLFKHLKQAGYNVIPSQTNFLYLHFDNDIEKEKVFNLLHKNGLEVCNLKIFGQNKSLRIGVGDRLVNKKIVKSLLGLK